MTAQIKVKVQRKATVRLKVLPRFPANVIGDNGIVITKDGRTYTFTIGDITDLTGVASIDATTRATIFEPFVYQFQLLNDNGASDQSGSFQAQVDYCEARGITRALLPPYAFKIDNIQISHPLLIEGAPVQVFSSASDDDPSEWGTRVIRTGATDVYCFKFLNSAYGGGLKNVCFIESQDDDASFVSPTAYLACVINLTGGTEYDRLCFPAVYIGLQLGQLADEDGTPNIIGSGGCHITRISGSGYHKVINIVRAADYLYFDQVFLNSSIGTGATNQEPYIQAHGTGIHSERCDSPLFSNIGIFGHRNGWVGSTNAEGNTNNFRINGIDVDFGIAGIQLSGTGAFGEVSNFTFAGNGGVGSFGAQVNTGAKLSISNMDARVVGTNVLVATGTGDIAVTNLRVNRSNQDNGGNTILYAVDAASRITTAGVLERTFGSFQMALFGGSGTWVQLGINSTGSGDYQVHFKNAENLTGNRTATITTGDANCNVALLETAQTVTGAKIFTALTTKFTSNAASLPAAAAGTLVQVGSSDGAETLETLDAFAAPAGVIFRRANTTAAAPSALASGNLIGYLGVVGYGTNAYSSNQIAVKFETTQAWTNSNQGCRIVVGVTPNNSTTRADAIALEQDGGLTLPPTVTGGSKGAGTANVSGGYYVGGTALLSPILAALGVHAASINGGVDVSQEFGTTGATLTNNTAKYTADFWEGYYNHGAASAVVTSGQIAAASFGAVLSGFSFGHRLKATTAISSIANGDFARHRQKIEGYRVASWGWGATGAKQIVVVFQIYSTGSGTGFVRLSNSAGDRFFYHEVTVAAGWNFVAFRVTGDTSGTWLKTTGTGLVFEFFSAGKEATPQSSLDAWGATAKVQTTNSTNLLGTNNNETVITGLYIDAGDFLATATDLPQMMRPFPETLDLAQRYWEKSYDYADAVQANTGAGDTIVCSVATGATSIEAASVFFKRRKRATPTITTYRRDGNVTNPNYWRYNVATYAAVTTSSPSETQFLVLFSGTAAGLSGGNAALMDGHWTADARL